jgi:hypothetical protein
VARHADVVPGAATLTPVRTLTVTIAILAALATSAAAEPPPSLFGINTGEFDSSYARFLRDMPTARTLGARWIHLTGANIKFRRGRVSFAQMDSQVNRARRLHLGVLMSLGGIEAACSLHPRPADPTTCPPTTARDLRVYAAYVRRLLHHFRGRVNTYESWLEPNQTSFWPPYPDAAQYARLLATEYRVVHAVRGDRLILAGLNSFSSIDGSPNSVAVLVYLHDLLADLHGARAFDIVGLHPYRYPPDPPDTLHWDRVPTAYPASGCDTHPWCEMTWTGELEAVEQEVANSGHGQPPMWLTEFGWPGATGPDSDGYHPSEQQQADNLRRAYEIIRSLPFIRAAFWFNLRDYNPRTRSPDPEFFGHYGLLRNDFSPKPAAAVFRQYAR